MEGLVAYGIFFLSFALMYALLALGLNVQWGYTGMLNVGIAAFFAVGAYTSAILTTAPSPNHLGGFDLPLPLGFVGAMVVSGLLAAAIGAITLNLRSDYLAIATIGIAEIVRLVLKNEEWLTNGVRGITSIPRPTTDLLPIAPTVLMLGVAVLLVALVYTLNQRAYRSPWGRVLRAIRDDEAAARAMGKNGFLFRQQAFVLGAAVMGLAGAYYAHFVGFVSPEAFDPIFATFIVWVMLIAGGSGNDKGAILGALVIWGVWTGTEMVINQLPDQYVTQGGAARILLIGVLLQVILLLRPEGLLPGRPPRPIVEDDDRRAR